MKKDKQMTNNKRDNDKKFSEETLMDKISIIILTIFMVIGFVMVLIWDIKGIVAIYNFVQDKERMESEIYFIKQDIQSIKDKQVLYNPTAKSNTLKIAPESCACIVGYCERCDTIFNYKSK